jgi:hypothetical protein
MKVVLKKKATSRRYPEKKDPTTQRVRIEGETFEITAMDCWEGPSVPEEQGYWERVWIVD